ncbi:hypothetical protein MC885_008484, partial [Smutsia gigantea]
GESKERPKEDAMNVPAAGPSTPRLPRSLLKPSPYSHRPARFLRQDVAQGPGQAGRGLAHVPGPPGVSQRVTPPPALSLLPAAAGPDLKFPPHDRPGVAVDLPLTRAQEGCSETAVSERFGGRESEPALIRASSPGVRADSRVCSPVPPAADRTTALQLCRGALFDIIIYSKTKPCLRYRRKRSQCLSNVFCMGNDLMSRSN